MKYKKVLLKLSGEALMGDRKSGIDPKIAKFIADEINEIRAMGAEVSVVVGGGNIYRGGSAAVADGVNEETSHYMGMLAICINGLALSDMFATYSLDNEVLSALGRVGKMANYDTEMAKKTLKNGKVLLLAGGTGKPFCSSDSGAALRAKELEADVIFKLTKVDGVYDCDPMTNKGAKKYSKLSFKEAIEKELGVMDKGAYEICQENNIPIVVFQMEKGNIKKAVMGEEIGTVIE